MSGANTSLGVDVGGTTIKWLVLAPGGVIVAEGCIPTPCSGPADVAERVAGLIRERPVDTIGVTVPGQLVRSAGTTSVIPNLPGNWSGFGFGAAVRERGGRAVALLNDVRALGVAELVLGAAREMRNALFVALGTGTGGAIALDGAVLVGDQDRVGEVGHMCFQPDGAMCGCGGRGCVEAYAGGAAIVSAATRGVTQGISPALVAATDRRIDRLTVEQVVCAARQGDEFSLSIMETAGKALGSGIGTVCALLGLQNVVIGGGIAAALDILRRPMHDELARRRRLVGDISVLTAQYGERAGAVGAALWGARHGAVEEVTQ